MIVIEDTNENNEAGNYRINNNKTTTSNSFEYKIKIIGSTPADNNILNTEFIVSLKYLSNFWRSLDFPLVKFKVQLDFSCKGLRNL